MNIINRNVMKYLKNIRVWILIIVIGSLFWFNFLLASTIVSLYFSYQIVALLLNNKIFDSILFRIAITPFFYVLVMQLSILATWLVSHSFPLIFSSVVSLLLIIIFWYFLHKKKYVQNGDISILSRGDIVALSVCVIVFVAIIAIPIKNNEFTQNSSILTLVNNAVDDSSHIGLLNDRIQFNRGMVLDSDIVSQTRTESVDFYPAGWHSANAIIIKSVNPNISTGIESVVAYAITKVFWFMLLIFIFVRSIFSLYLISVKKNPPVAVTIAMLGASLLFVFWTLTNTFSEGFYSFIPQLISIPLIILSLVQIYITKNIDQSSDLHRSLLFPILLSVGTALSWLLLFPVFVGIVVLAIIFKSRLSNNYRQFFIKLVKMPIYYLGAYILMFCAIFVQVNASTGSNIEVSFLEGILLGGGIVTYPITLYTFVLIGAGVFLYYCYKKRINQIIVPLSIYIFTVVVFVTLLYLLQQYFTQNNSYYYFKSLNTLTLALSMLCVLGIGLIIGYIQKNTNSIIALMSGFVLISLSLQFAYPNPPIFSYVKGIRVVEGSTNNQLWGIMKDNYTQNNYNDGTISIFYPNSNLGLNEVGSMLLKSNKPYSGCFYATKSASFKIPPKDFTADVVQLNCQPNQKIIYYTDQLYVDHIRASINKYKLGNQVTVKTITY